MERIIKISSIKSSSNLQSKQHLRPNCFRKSGTLVHQWFWVLPTIFAGGGGQLSPLALQGANSFGRVADWNRSARAHPFFGSQMAEFYWRKAAEAPPSECPEDGGPVAVEARCGWAELELRIAQREGRPPQRCLERALHHLCGTADWLQVLRSRPPKSRHLFSSPAAPSQAANPPPWEGVEWEIKFGQFLHRVRK